MTIMNENHVARKRHGRMMMSPLKIRRIFGNVIRGKEAIALGLPAYAAAVSMARAARSYAALMSLLSRVPMTFLGLS